MMMQKQLSDFGVKEYELDLKSVIYVMFRCPQSLIYSGEWSGLFRKWCV